MQEELGPQLGGLSRGVTHHACAAAGAVAAGATAAAGSTMSAAQSVPGLFTDALERAPGFAQHASGRVVEAAKHAPEAASNAWESLLAALQRSSQLTGEEPSAACTGGERLRQHLQQDFS